MARLRLTIAYVGTRYHGWQIQDKVQPPPTIQGALEAVFARVLGQPTRLHAAGRTDSGVHADAQVAHCDIADAKACLNWQRILNTSLPGDISVLDVERVDKSFHARLDAIDKTYTYQFWMDRRCMPPRLHPFAWDCGPLNILHMRAALPYLLGQHDFRSLQNMGTPIEDCRRTVYECVLDPALALMPHTAALALRVRADGFLKQMVRNIAGLLVAVGQGKCAPDAIPHILASHDRRLAPLTAPARGLTLTCVRY